MYHQNPLLANSPSLSPRKGHLVRGATWLNTPLDLIKANEELQNKLSMRTSHKSRGASSILWWCAQLPRFLAVKLPKARKRKCLRCISPATPHEGTEIHYKRPSMVLRNHIVCLCSSNLAASDVVPPMPLLRKRPLFICFYILSYPPSKRRIDT